MITLAVLPGRASLSGSRRQPAMMDILGHESGSSQASRRRGALEELHEQIASGDAEGRAAALEALRGLDGVAAPLPSGVPLSRAAVAAHAAKQAGAARAAKVEEVSTGKIYMHARHMVCLIQTFTFRPLRS